MSYIASWLEGEEVVAEDQFQDLLEAQAYILEHLPEYHERGVAGVKVWDEHTTYFSIH